MALVAASASTDRVDDAARAAADLAEQLKGRVPEGHRAVGLLFSSINIDHAALLARLAELLPFEIAGCTTYAEASDRGYADESVTLLVVAGERLRVGVGVGEGLDAGADGPIDSAWQGAREGLAGEPAKLVIAMPDTTFNGRSQEVVDGLSNRIGDALLLGGLPGDGGRWKQTLQLARGKVHTGALVLVALGGDELSPTIVTRSGWRPTGKRARATKSEANRLSRIDDTVAIDYLRRLIPDVEDPEILGTYPMALLDETVFTEGSPYFVIRSPFQYDRETGAIIYGGPIPEGCSLQIARGSRDDIIGGAREAAQVALARHGRAPSAALFFSCAGRKLLLGLEVDREIAALSGALPERVPIAGFYSHGEIGPIDSSEPKARAARFHNCTMVLCLL